MLLKIKSKAWQELILMNYMKTRTSRHVGRGNPNLKKGRSQKLIILNQKSKIFNTFYIKVKSIIVSFDNSQNESVHIQFIERTMKKVEIQLNLYISIIILI